VRLETARSSLVGDEAFGTILLAGEEELAWELAWSGAASDHLERLFLRVPFDVLSVAAARPAPAEELDEADGFRTRGTEGRSNRSSSGVNMAVSASSVDGDEGPKKESQMSTRDVARKER